MILIKKYNEYINFYNGKKQKKQKNGDFFTLFLINNIEKSEPLFYLKMCCIFMYVCIYTF